MIVRFSNEFFFYPFANTTFGLCFFIKNGGFFLRITGVFTHRIAHLHHDLGDIAKGFYGMDTTTSLDIMKKIADNPKINIVSHSLGNLDVATALRKTKGYLGQWTSLDAPFFADQSRANSVIDES